MPRQSPRTVREAQAAAMARARQELGRAARAPRRARSTLAAPDRAPAAAAALADPRTLLAAGRALPILTIPWDALCSDNEKTQPNGRGGLTLTPRYRRAKEATHDAARSGWHVRGLGHLAPLSGDVVLSAVLFEPAEYVQSAARNKNRRDPGNYRKLVTDALQGVCYGDDAQLVRETWARGAVDPRRPRLEVVVLPANRERDADRSAA